MSAVHFSARLAAAPAPARNFLGNRFVYCVLSQRAGGLSVGINLNPDGGCNFDCAYCEIDRTKRLAGSQIDLPVLAAELRQMLTLTAGNGLARLPAYRTTPPELLQLREVALSGDGEPTLSDQFQEVVEAVVHLRTQRDHSFFKTVLITNGTGLHLRPVEKGLALLLPEDEVWAKLDVGSQAHLQRVNRSEVPFIRILDNIVLVGTRRPIVIQSLFPLLHGTGPSEQEIDDYLASLIELRDRGTQVKMVQVYSAHRPPQRPDCAHLPLPALSAIARRVRLETGLRAEVF